MSSTERTERRSLKARDGGGRAERGSLLLGCQEWSQELLKTSLPWALGMGSQRENRPRGEPSRCLWPLAPQWEKAKPSSLIHPHPPTSPPRVRGEMGPEQAPPPPLPGGFRAAREQGRPSPSGRSRASTPAPSGALPRLPRPLLSHTLCSRAPGTGRQPHSPSLTSSAWGVEEGVHQPRGKHWRFL